MSRLLKQKINQKKAKIAVIGQGYVGLPLAISFARRGFLTYGIDLNEERIAKLKRKSSYITDIKSKEIAQAVNSKKFVPTTDFSLIGDSDVVLICVPTPLKRKYTPDISYILSAVKTINKYIKKNTLIVLESTTYPGTTEELIQPALEKSGLKVGKDFFLSFSPERIDPGNKDYEVTKIPKVVGGTTPACGSLTKALYEQVIKSVHIVSSTRAAEMTKLLENSFRIINIGWINEVAMSCHEMGIDVWEVIEAAKTKPFGFMPFYPGLGVGGHCIPDDPLYLYWKAKQYGFNSKFIKLSADTNSSMPAYAVERIKEIVPKSFSKSKILVLGATYKKDVFDLRKSPSLTLIEELKNKKATVDYYDPIVPYLKIGSIKQESIQLTKANIEKYDCVIVAVDHTTVNYKLILNSAKRIFDVRNVYKKPNKKVHKL